MNCVIFTHADLDGAGSVLTLKWCFPKFNFSHVTTTAAKFRDDFTKWCKANNPSDYKIFVTDLNVVDCYDIIDLSNLILIDHHQSDQQYVSKFTKAKCVLEEYTSCAKLIYKTFKDRCKVNLSLDQKKLIALIDDYDSYKLSLAESYDLNTVYWGFQGDKIQSFCDVFEEGFNGFNAFQKNIITIHDNKVKQTIKDLNLFSANVSIQGSNRFILSTFADSAINDVAQYLIENCGADIAIVVSLKSSHVSLRKNSSCSVNLATLAEKLCEGGGHEFSSGGKITDKFMEFTKLFQPFSDENN